MEPILTIDNLNSFGGNMLRQGDKSQLKYRLRDVGNKNLAISSKSCQITMYGRNYTTIVYETTATVSSDNTVSFTIDKILPKGIFYLEFTVGDYIFPTDHREFFEITPSGKGMEANIIEIVGVDAVVRKAVDLINVDPSLIIDEDKLVTDIISNTGIGSINDYYQAFNDLKPRAELSISKSAEALTKSQNALNVANGIDAKATNALSLSESADTLSKSVQEQFNQVVIGGDSSVESAQARVNADGVAKATLKERLDDEHNEVTSQLAQTEQQQFKNSPVSHKSQRPLIVWIDDDAHKGVYTKIAPILREYNIKMTSALITGAEIGLPVENVPDRVSGTSIMTYEQMKELHDEGIVEFVSHTHTHDANNRLTQMTEASLRFEFSETQRVLKALGFNHRHLVYPFGTENSFVQRVASEYFDSAVHIRGGYVGRNMNQYKINRQSMDSTDFDAIKAEMDKAIETNTGLILMSHIDQYGGLDLTKVRQVIEYAQNNGMKFVTLSEFIQEKGNLLQFGENKITANGDVFGGKIGTVQRRQDITHNGDIYQFEENKLTITRVTPSNAVAYGLPTSFNLITYRDEQLGYSFQKAIFSDAIPSRTRVYNSSNDDWGNWFSSVITLQPLYVTVDTTISPGNTHQQSISAGRASTNNMYIIKPETNISRFIRFEAFCVNNGELIVRITNTSQADRAVNNTFKIDILKNS